MSHCGNCNTKLSGGICQWCQEELYIFTEQYEYLPPLSDEFAKKVKMQKKQVKDEINH
ncbi:hypothetical protein LCGC14_1822190 [marine sediment metagenome]|uniref:Uncharacterized protein n=1 Tax=marine sediment metagenome TaxID=412755 RepID=A0A0F9JI32_9ZZZZ